MQKTKKYDKIIIEMKKEFNMFREYLIETYNLTHELMADIDRLLTQRVATFDLIVILDLVYSSAFELDLQAYASDCLLYD